MGKLSTLEGFSPELITRKLRLPKGFSLTAKLCENMILIIIDDLRDHPDFEGDKSAGGWPDILQSLSEIGLDPAKAVISLRCRPEETKSNSKKTFNIGVVQLGWACATTQDLACNRASVCTPGPERAHLRHQMRG